MVSPNQAFRKASNEIAKTYISLATGMGTLIAEESSMIYKVVQDKIEESRGEFTHLEEAVKEQLSSKPKKKKRTKSPKAAADSGGFSMASPGSNMWDDFNIDDISSDEST